MRSRFHASSLLATAFMFSALGTPLDAQAPLRILFCRGGSSGFQFRVVADPSPNSSAETKIVRMGMTYRVSSAFVPEHVQTLSPGSCGWDTIGVSRPPPGDLMFDIQANAQSLQVRQGVPVDRSVTAAVLYPDTASIRRYLSVSNQYWVFFVNDDAERLVVSHNPWDYDPAAILAGSVQDAPTEAAMPAKQSEGSTTLEDARAAGAPTTAAMPAKQPDGTTTLGGARLPGGTAAGTTPAPLRFIEVNTVLDKFTIKFSARPNGSPTVHYSTSRPIREPSTGRWFFEGGALQGSGAISLGGFQAEVSEGTRRAVSADYIAWSRLAPERGKVYNFIITVPRGIDVQEEQYTGQLTTVGQHVRVVFSEINLLNDSDKGSAGDLIFLGLGDGPCGEAEIGNSNSELSWESGKLYKPNAVMECPNAPDRIRIMLWGDDHDSELGRRLPPYFDWTMRGGTDGFGDWNVAKAELNVGTSPLERFVRLPFRMRSIDGNVLMFEAYGHVEVTRR
jgi:hypothetical protein